jgi:Na+/proline symporter
MELLTSGWDTVLLIIYVIVAFYLSIPIVGVVFFGKKVDKKDKGYPRKTVIRYGIPLLVVVVLIVLTLIF